MVSVNAGATEGAVVPCAGVGVAAAGGAAGPGATVEVGAAALLAIDAATAPMTAPITANDREKRFLHHRSMQGTVPGSGMAVARPGHIPPPANAPLPCPFMSASIAIHAAHAISAAYAMNDVTSTGATDTPSAVVHLPTWTVIPFAALLGAIAVLPLLKQTAHWWESNRNKFMVSAGCGLIALAIVGALEGGSGASKAALHAAAEFIPFIVLLFSLYVISGGILISGDIPGSPRINTAILALGALAANLLGTTGASMLLIRPLLRANGKRKHRVHVVIFFIFIVSNIGGLLLPIGDPPLFLGYLRGVPFNWTLTLFPEWLIANLLLLTVFFATDRYLARKEGAAPEQSDVPDPVIRIAGAQNVLWLAGVVLAAAFMVPGKQFFRTGLTIPEGGREGIMLMCAAASLILTPRAVRKENHFAFGPIIEVAALFGGLFLAMQPALELLIDRGGQLGVQTPAQFFWATGLLSSFLDNAPTYLVFADVARTVTPQDITNGINYSGAVIDPALLGGVSCGAVFMGANTYIGNGPNLMVAAIAREDGVPMPTFFGYMLWSGAILMPIFILITFVMF
jgi:Na+/H+ antiporter NhaD/arsenite permease-like protein